MASNLTARYLLNGCGYAATHWLSLNHQSNQIPQWIQEKLNSKNHEFEQEYIATLIQYHNSKSCRQPIYTDTKAIVKLIQSLEVHGQHKVILQGLLQEIYKQNVAVIKQSWVLPFSTTAITAGAKTGRDIAKGSSITSLPKKYWGAILKPESGFSYVVFDYVNQEPAIIAAKSGAKEIQDMYLKGDLYDTLNQRVTEGQLERKQFKSLFIKHLYGQRADAIAEGLKLNKAKVQGWIARLKTIIKLLNKFLDMQLYQAKKAGEVRSKDWRMLVGKGCTDLSLRNWPVQACGADIMRRACLALEEANIPVILTNHDAFLVKIKTKHIDQQSAFTTKILGDVSAEVLNGFRLKVQTELIINQFNENE
jgi:hypothetical protein